MEFGAANFLMKPPDTSYLNIPNLLSEEFSRQRSFLTYIPVHLIMSIKISHMARSMACNFQASRSILVEGGGVK